MTYGEKVLSRLMTPGMLILALGAAAVYLSGPLADKIAPKKREQTNVIIKAVGGVVALVGAMMVMGFI